MLRDRYKKWGINDKNARLRGVAVAKRRFTTQTALLHSPSIVELNDDESPVAQEPFSTQDEYDLLDLRMVLAGIRPGSPRAALLSLDSRIHEILHGLSYWCQPTAPDSAFALTPERLDPNCLRSNRKIPLGLRCYAATLGLLRRDLWSAMETIQLFSEFQSRDWINWLEGRPFEQCRILWFLCERVTQELGPQHPVTLICIWAARGLPFEDLTSILKGLFRLYVSQVPLINASSVTVYFDTGHFEDRFRKLLRIALDMQQSRLHAVAAKSAS